MTYIFSTPTVKQRYRYSPRTGSMTFALLHGVSVFRISGTWHEQRFPSAAQVDAADRFYRGGLVHEVTSTQRTELIAAGYGAYIVTEV